MKKNISIVTNCFNEEANVTALYQAVKSIMEKQDKYNYEHIFIDNNSYDKTLAILKEIASNDKNIKIISNMMQYLLMKVRTLKKIGTIFYVIF